MSNYKTHSQFNLFLALPLAIVAIIYFKSPSREWLIPFASAFIYGTLFMSPDMDVANKIKLKSFRGILTLPFRGYASLFRHRGVSHSILFGTMTRLLYIAALIAIIAIILGSALPDQKSLWAFWKKHKDLLIAIFAGFFLADICHLLLDLKIFSKKR